MSTNPIFIAGCGRSGTTYLQSILDNHPDVFIPTESLFIPDYLQHGRSLPSRLRNWLLFNEPQLRAWYDGPRFDADDPATAIARCHEHAAAQENKRIWGQKTPRFVRYLDLFRRAYPGAKFILVYRDPRAVAASMLNSPVHPFSLGWACARWVRDNKPVYECLTKPCPDVLVIKYEDFILHFDQQLEAMFRFLQLPALTRADLEQRGRVRTYRNTSFDVASNNVRDGLAPQPKTIDAWRKHLSEGQVREIERRCMPLMEQMGYQPLPPGPTGLQVRPMESLHSAWSQVRNLGILFQYLRHWPYYLVHTALRTAAMRLYGKRIA